MILTKPYVRWHPSLYTAPWAHSVERRYHRPYRNWYRWCEGRGKV